MKTVIVRIGDVMTTQKCGEHFTQVTQTNSGGIPPEHYAKRALGEELGHEEWQRRTDANWQQHLETLQRCVCELLLKNQQLRMSLMAADEREREYRDAVRLQG